MSGKKNKDDGVVHVATTIPDWDQHFTPPEYLYRIILVCLFFGFLLFMVFFALARYLRWQNKQRAILSAQQAEFSLEESQFPFGVVDGQLLCPDDPAGDEIPLQEHVKECTCNPKEEDACVCQPLKPQTSSAALQQEEV